MVVGIDETTLDKVARLLPAVRTVATDATALLAGTLASVFDVRAQQFVRVDYHGDAQQNEKVGCRALPGAAGRPAPLEPAPVRSGLLRLPVVR